MSGDHNMYCSANNPKDEWTDLPTLVSVCNAQTDGWEIEFETLYGGWAKWDESSWHRASQYRARPRQPKMKTVKMLCWYTGSSMAWWDESNVMPYEHKWIRIPAQDIEIEISEGV